MEDKLSKKFDLDKYYTPDDVVEYVVSVVKDVVGVDWEYVIEPSAGGGAFINPINNTFKGSKVFLDLLPTTEGVLQQDYLQYTPPEGKCLVIGNPPFGTRNTLSVKFFKKSLYADVIAFIQPISQLNNTQQMYEFDLIHSEDLGVVNFYNQYGDVRGVPCCFNIYKKPEDGVFNKKKKYKFKEVEVFDYRKIIHVDIQIPSPPISLCSWGSKAGKECAPKTYTSEIHIRTSTKDIEDFVRDFDWSDYLSTTATPALYRWQVYEVLLEHFDLTEC